MRILIWEVKVNGESLAKLQWKLWKIFKIKPIRQCGRTKNYKHLCCSQPIDSEHCYIINEGKMHEVRCKCCNNVRIMSNKYIKNEENTWWSEF